MIRAENIEKSFNGERVLKSVSLEIGRGEYVSVMGKSGSGKSTLISILGGFLSPDSGRVLWDGEDISSFDEKKSAALRSSKLGFVFQSFKLIPTLNARDNLFLPATLGRHINGETLRYADEVTAELGISELLDKYPAMLSGGQCQRVAIARSLIYKPEILILDEPTGALDSDMERRVMNMLSRINKELGTTVVQVTHSLAVAEYGDRIIQIKDGEIGI